jgi:hypothetical protein
MKIGEMIILDSRTDSSPASTWTEYLCLKRLENNQYELSVRAYEVLAEEADYYNEDTDTYDIPEEINGKKVIGSEDVYIVGGDLLEHSDEILSLNFTNLTPSEAKKWLEEADWLRENIWNELSALIRSDHC